MRADDGVHAVSSRHRGGQVKTATLTSAQVAEGELVEVDLGADLVVVGRLDGCVFALDAFCPHAGASLASGRLEDGKVVCPLHGWGFDARDGACDVSPRVRAAVVPIHEAQGIVVVGPVAGSDALR